MDGKKFGSIGGFVVLVILIIWWRFQNRAEDSEDIKADAIKIISQAEGFEQNKDLMLKMADRAHNVAFDRSYKMAGRRTRAKFDDDKYIEEFFLAMFAEADMRNRSDIKKSLLALKARIDAPADTMADEANLASGAEPEREATKLPSPETAAAPAAESARSARADIDALPDNKLSEVVWQNISKPLEPFSQEKETDAVRKMSPGQRMVYLTWALEAEVNNGGFDRYFANGPGRFAKEAVVACKLIGAKENAKLLRRAIVAYVRLNPDQEIVKVDKTVKGYMKKYKDKDLGKVDTAFFDCKENVEALRVKYIRAHMDEFAME